MVNSLLFRWEDSQALQHHCGFCERPLSHPGARASCFGTHSEPCHRFHQAMFMRNRAHTCAYCCTIDEAHYKRHHELVDQLRNIYESCGEVDWTIIPVEPGDPRRGRSVDTQSTDSESIDGSLAPEETSISKRERKDAKCLARAASRARVVTQEEIKYIDSALHPAEGVSGSDSAGPANVEEIQLIEAHLRYNAHVYNNHSSRSALKKFAKIPDVDVDFDGEMERILDTFRITELVKRNLRNRGLQGKSLKNFDGLVEAFKNAVVEDLVLVKKDMMEIKMRRAGYLRYTNKTAYGIVEDRYTDKDWKTGERITSSSSDSSSLTSPAEEPVMLDSEGSDTSVWPTPPSVQGPDQRHLQHIHTCVSGDDGMEQEVIEPYHAPLLPLMPNINPNKPAVLRLKVVENQENRIPLGSTNRGWLRRDAARQAPLSHTLRTLDEEKPSPPRSPRMPSSDGLNVSVKPAWGQSKSLEYPTLVKQSPAADLLRVDGHQFPALSSTFRASRVGPTRSNAPAVQTPQDMAASLRGPERALTPVSDSKVAHPVVSQKKAKKAQREAKRKAKKVSDPEEASSPITVNDANRANLEQGISSVNATVNDTSDARDNVKLQDHASEAASQSAVDQILPDTVGIVIVEEQVTIVVPPPILSYTTHGKHDHWTRFTRNFIVDQLTAPLLQSFEGCSHGSSCLFESHGIRDCPFHEPHCPCGDPLQNQCFLVHPDKQMCSSGPYNRAHGERLLAVYEQHERTKGRVMLVDDDLVTYFMDDTNTPSKPDHARMPHRLLQEHTEFLEGYERGPLMRQEQEFERLFIKNMTMKHPITMRMLQDIQRQNTNRKATIKLCYCYTEVQCVTSAIKKEFGRDAVTCSYHKCKFGGIFHKRCVKKLGVEKVTRWYCTACEKEMTKVACKALRVPYIDEEAMMKDAEKIVAEVVKKPGSVTDRFKSLLQKLYVNEMGDELKVEDVD